MTQATTEGAPADDEEDLLNTAQVAKKLNITRRYLYELIASGEIETIRVGTEHRIEPAELRRYLGRNRQRAGIRA
jgi:excisionase family DNA binding protein